MATRKTRKKTTRRAAAGSESRSVAQILDARQEELLARWTGWTEAIRTLAGDIVKSCGSASAAPLAGLHGQVHQRCDDRDSANQLADCAPVLKRHTTSRRPTDMRFSCAQQR